MEEFKENNTNNLEESSEELSIEELEEELEGSDDAEVVEESDKITITGTKVYHVNKRSTDNKRTIKFRHGKKVIKIFDTKEEAMQYANALADNQGGVVLFHASKGKYKGKIREAYKGKDQESTFEEEEVEVYDDTEVIEDSDKTTITGTKVYHVNKRSTDNKWTIKFAYGKKVIKTFDTKEEAVQYANALADNQGGVVLIHASKGKYKGKIRDTYRGQDTSFDEDIESPYDDTIDLEESDYTEIIDEGSDQITLTGRKVYHVNKRSTDNKWTIKFAYGKKVIKIFDTKEEAMQFANALADNQGGVVLFHASKGKYKGKIRDTYKSRAQEPTLEESLEAPDDTEVIEDSDKITITGTKVYHVNKRSSDNKWTIKFAYGKKVIKTFDTKEEAMQFANALADNQGGVVLFHASKGKYKGKIIKQG